MNTLENQINVFVCYSNPETLIEMRSLLTELSYKKSGIRVLTDSTLDLEKLNDYQGFNENKNN